MLVPLSPSSWKKSTTRNGCTPRWATCHPLSSKLGTIRRPLRGKFLYEFSEARQIFPPIGSLVGTGGGPLSGFAPGPHRLDESAAGYSLAGCAPAEPASASPGDYEYAVQWSCRSRSFHPTANSVLTVCVSPGGRRICSRPSASASRTTRAKRRSVRFLRPSLWSRSYRLSSVLPSASIRLTRISLIRVRCPSPLDLSQSRTLGSRRRLTGTFRRTSRSRTVLANCSSVRRGMSSKLMPESSPAACCFAMRLSVRRSFSVHRLFLISSDFMLFSPAGRDDADDFFAMTVLPICMYNQQHRNRIGLDVSGPDRMPTRLSSFVDAVQPH